MKGTVTLALISQAVSEIFEIVDGWMDDRGWRNDRAWISSSSEPNASCELTICKCNDRLSKVHFNINWTVY